jgi:hypothetical protein
VDGMNEIKVVHEDITDRDADFTTAKQLLHKAERIYLLGFGFGTTNVERLGLANLSPTGAFGGTAFRMSQKESGNCRTLSGGNVQLYNTLACLQFLREVALLD